MNEANCCVRFPPVVAPPSGYTRYPEVRRDDGCGEFVDRLADANKERMPNGS